MTGVRSLLLAVLALAASSCSLVGPTAWTADAGVYGTTRHFGPAGYLCGLAYDIRYHGTEIIDRVDVQVRYPDAFAPRATGLPSADHAGWRRSTLPVSGLGSLADAARLGHASGAVGAICLNGPSDLDSLRGSVVRVTWHTTSGDHAQQFTVSDVRGEMTLYAGDLSTDGQVRIEWQPH